MATWYEMLKDEMKLRGDDFESRICTLDEADLKVAFNVGYGHLNGRPFTAWGENWVYFPLSYDGSESVGSAPRNPCDIAMPHQGGDGF
jgi:hypothetical protein